jgi:hypothetical protein
MDQDHRNIPSQCHERQKGKGHGKHMILMFLCCLVPIIILLILPKTGILSKFSWLVPLLCPVLMIGMMIPMMINHKDKKDDVND